MSLISFHRFLIATAIIFCVGFSLWELVSYRATGNLWAALVGGGFGLAALGLVYYLRHLSRFLGIPAGRSKLTKEVPESFSSNGRGRKESVSVPETAEDFSGVKRET